MVSTSEEERGKKEALAEEGAKLGSRPTALAEPIELDGPSEWSPGHILAATKHWVWVSLGRCSLGQRALSSQDILKRFVVRPG